nr:PREDICTED: xenotropic and polytropic retrovirus receptor 1 [Latimeria chalumnae]|eukprot:XP_014341088.1 PREDICTED: xenotropic and polytropic retrovirus receptor 1 [Latimeria chalumnae]
MKFAEHLSAHITPEWRKQYIQYEAFKEMLYAAQDQAPSIEVTDEDTVKRYFAKFEEKFFQACEKELAKINTFYSEKLAEAQRRFATLQNELQSSLDAQRESSNLSTVRQRRKKVFHLSHEARVHHRNLKDLKLAFSEFYLSLILLQNYQASLHPSRKSAMKLTSAVKYKSSTAQIEAFCSFLNKNHFASLHGDCSIQEKALFILIGTDDIELVFTRRGQAKKCVKTAFSNSSHIANENKENGTEYGRVVLKDTLVTTELEHGDRQKAMKRLRVPPLGAAQPAPAWTTFRVGLYFGVFLALSVAIVIAGVTTLPKEKSVWPLIRIYRGGFLLIEFLFLLGINTYGWRQAGVNHVLIFELNPRNNLSHQHLFEIAGILGVLWCLSLLSCMFAAQSSIPMQVNPIILYGLMVLFFINPTKSLYYKSRFWLLKLLFRVFTAPFHKVEFADFWLADQLNSLGMILMDLEYMICFYCFELKWEKEWWPIGLFQGLKGGPGLCHTYSYGLRAIIQCLPAWLRFTQCLRRYRDTKRAFPHLVNAGKYSTTFFVVAFAALHSTHKNQDRDAANVYFYLWIVFSIISSCYTLIWDLKMDWGLFDRNAGENTFLREEIVYPQKAYYYCAIIEDTLLRFAWVVHVSLTSMNVLTDAGDIIATVCAPLEVFRRFVWNFFRLENEHLNNCGEFRAVRDISVAPLNADDQTLLEQMMDQEDGVKNRQKNKVWKHSMSVRHPRLASQSKIRDTKVLIEDTDDEAYT